MATVYRIHPAIGIARVGNSAEFFIGPERVGEHPMPQGGFKDAQCRVKRQAARFRIFAHHDDGTFAEITDAEAEITWTVHLVNKKAAHPQRGNGAGVSAADLTIDPGARTTDGPNQARSFDNGVIRFPGQQPATVPLGEMRTDNANHLLVLPGAGAAASPAGNGIGDFWGNPGWYDDIADGPVSAAIKLRSDGSSPPVMGAWVITAPPKFAPSQDTPTTLYDRILQAMVDAGKLATPTATSYVRDVYPVLKRAEDARWVVGLGAAIHNWTHPVPLAARAAIFSRVRPPGNMPALLGGDPGPTPVQRLHLERWKNNDPAYTEDWSGAPPGPEASVSPGGMDRAALDACVGGSFYPGIEAGGLNPSDRPILDAANYLEPFRINHATVSPGTLSASMALPWQADFFACSDNWWPVPRPNRVLPPGTANPLAWTRGIGSYQDMIAKWHSLGFVVPQQGGYFEVERCDTPSIMLLTPTLNFRDVPQGPMGMVRELTLAIVFEVSAPGSAVTLQYTAGGGVNHPQLTAVETQVTVGPTGGTSIATARLRVRYRTGTAGSAIPTQTVTIQEPVSGQTWFVTIDANTVARKTAAVALVLDRSGSMQEDRGDGMPKHTALREAAEAFVNVMLEGDGVGIVRYDHDAQVMQPIVTLGGPGDPSRTNTIDLIHSNQLDPAGATSIGDGIHEGRGILNASSGFDLKVLTVLTDGVENRARYIADVASSINERTYAVGLGTPQNTSAPALQNLSGNHGGYLLITGAITDTNAFLLQKYFLQILAGVSNADVVLDPEGELTPGAVHRIPFQLTEADAGVDVILLSPHAPRIDFRLQTPTGRLIEPWRAASETGMRFVQGRQLTLYRLALPVPVLPDRFEQGGTWHALLRLGEPRTKPTREREDGTDSSILEGLFANPAVRGRAALPAVVPGSDLRRRFEVTRLAEAHLESMVRERRPVPRERRSARYSLLVHSYSNISLDARVEQSGWDPGAHVTVSATLFESGIAMERPATVWAEWTRPDGTTSNVALPAVEAGRYLASFDAAQPGVHALRVRARGTSAQGMPFTRERTITAAVWRGGDRDAETAAGGGGRIVDAVTGRDSLCDLLRCLVGEGRAIEPALERRLREAGLNIGALRKCIDAHCKTRRDSDRDE